MSGCSTSACNEVQDPNHQDPNPDYANLSKISEHPPFCDVNEREEEEEDEDVDFNPFLKENNSVEASSSLSSEVEDLDTDVADSREKSYTAFDIDSAEKERGDIRDSQTSGNVDHGEDAVEIQTTSSPKTASATTIYKESAVITPSENGIICDKDDAEGAICMRTRARYSLASFTLDELETFLQESDDEDDLQNVDEEEEYRKFLAGVLRGDDSQNLIGNTNVDEEDEENDADFQLELEEALESEPEEVEVRRLTRLSKCQKSSLERSKKLSGNSNRSLKPLIPYTTIRSFPAYDRNRTMPNMAPSYVQPVNNGTTCGFTPHQIGQLHCLIHEHVQLLIQVFSLSVLEPGKSNTAAKVKELVLEMLKKREQALTCRTVPHPSFCFFPPYVQSSVSDGLQRMLPPKGSNISNRVPNADTVSLSSGRNMHLHDDQASSFQTPECTFWAPYVCGPKLSVVDVAPFRLVENFINDVSSAVRAYERHQIELGFESGCQKEPLFPLHDFPCSAGSDEQGEIENNPPNSNGGLCSSPSKQMTRKTKAANLLEKAKSQPVASVPIDIAKLAQRFWPFFNPALYPHKPPPVAIVNHLLFTDAEDELLALGLMEYNTDWKAIQQRFLPCKSKHQIFVRQKNRASSKAPENPIKAVRRMKNSPLTSEEVSRIEMGIKMFNFDWLSIWRSFVPYRDPSLLPRQWRIARGTQKSYACDASKNAKRRLNAKRRTSKTSPSTRHLSSEKEGDSTDSGDNDNHIDKEEEAYVHEAFLADWRPDDDHVSSSIPACMSTQSPILSKYPPASSSQAVPRPYRSRKQCSARLVKLAPGLPPVNLPPSVRVMSQSAFKGSQAETSLKTDVNSLVKSGQTHSDMQMHPLLFQAPQDGLLPGSTTTPGSFSFFPRKQPQLNLSLFRNLSHIGDGKNASSSFGSDFHPLLQRTDDMDTQSVGKKDNELDLDIHLSNQKAAGNSCETRAKDSGIPRFMHRNKRSRKAYDEGCDDSIPEIIMEQEELSDSEEEFGENVEFECEEMADSEGESMSDSDDTQVPKAQNDSGVSIKTNASSFNLNSCPMISTLPNPENAGSSRNPRKRICRSNLNMGAGSGNGKSSLMSVENAENVGAEKTG